MGSNNWKTNKRNELDDWIKADIKIRKGEEPTSAGIKQKMLSVYGEIAGNILVSQGFYTSRAIRVQTYFKADSSGTINGTLVLDSRRPKLVCTLYGSKK